jgi:hypothetical protein
VRGVLIAAVICLALGVGALFAFSHGTTGFSFGAPLSTTSVHIDIITTGIPALLGALLTVIGALLLIIATIIALADLPGRNGDNLPPKRRESAFEE